MTLDNLVGNTLERIEPDPAAIGRLVRAAERNLAGARVETISPDAPLPAPNGLMQQFKRHLALATAAAANGVDQGQDFIQAWVVPGCNGN